jgi:hypothetical protein
VRWLAGIIYRDKSQSLITAFVIRSDRLDIAIGQIPAVKPYSRKSVPTETKHAKRCFEHFQKAGIFASLLMPSFSFVSNKFAIF